MSENHEIGASIVSEESPAQMALQIVNLTAAPENEQLLTQALAGGAPVLAIYLPAPYVIAEALLQKQEPADALQAWSTAMRPVLTVARDNRNRVVLVAADIFSAAPQQTLTRVQDQLGLASGQMPQPEVIARATHASEQIDPVVLYFSDGINAADPRAKALEEELRNLALPAVVQMGAWEKKIATAQLYIEQNRQKMALLADHDAMKNLIELQQVQMTMLQKALEDQEKSNAILRKNVGGK